MSISLVWTSLLATTVSIRLKSVTNLSPIYFTKWLLNLADHFHLVDDKTKKVDLY